MPKFAANLSMLFTEVPFLERFSKAASAGFQAVEFLFPYAYDKQQLHDLLQENNLKNVLFNLYPGNWEQGERGLAALPGREEDFRASVELALEYALKLATPKLHFMAGIITPAMDLHECHAVYCSNLAYAAKIMQQHAIEILIEPINTRDMPGYYLSSQEHAHAIREQVVAPNLKVQMDLYHAQIMQGDVTTRLLHYLPYIGHIQIASVPHRNEPDDGELNYPYLFSLLDQAGFEGWIGCEYRPRKSTEVGLCWLKPYL